MDAARARLLELERRSVPGLALAGGSTLMIAALLVPEGLIPDRLLVVGTTLATLASVVLAALVVVVTRTLHGDRQNRCLVLIGCAFMAVAMLELMRTLSVPSTLGPDGFSLLARGCAVAALALVAWSTPGRYLPRRHIGLWTTVTVTAALLTALAMFEPGVARSAAEPIVPLARSSSLVGFWIPLALAVLGFAGVARHRSRLEAASADAGTPAPYDIGLLAGALALHAAAEGGVALAALVGKDVGLVAQTSRAFAIWLVYRSIVAQGLRFDDPRLVAAQHVGGVATFDWDIHSGAGLWGGDVRRMLGSDALPPKTLGELLERVHPDDRERALAAHRRALEQVGAFTYELRIGVGDGAQWVRVQGDVQGDAAGRPVRMVGAAIEITERRQAEERLRHSQRRLEGIVEGADDAIVSVDAENRITLYNRGAESIFGWTAGETLGRPLDILLPAGIAGRHREAIRAFGAGSVGSRRMGERSRVLGRHKDGHEFSAEASISKLELPEGMVYTVILRDVTTRIAAERMLREQEERLREAHERVTLAMSATGLGHWQRDLVSGRIDCSQAMLTIFGRKVEEFDGHPDSMLAWVHPDDRSAFRAAFTRALAERRPTYQNESRVVRPDGEVRWLFRRALIKFDATGKPSSVLGVALDTTERKRLEAGLEARVAARTAELAGVLDAVPDAIIDASTDGHVRSVNASAARIFGYDRADLVGHHESVLLADDGGRILLEEAWRTWEHDGPGQSVRVTCRRKDGTTFPAIVVGNVILDRAGVIASRVAVIRDITGERERQQALQQSQKMEVVGQLTGGLAHDFNNLLTVITGNLELLDMRLEDETTRDLVRRADEAARMGARLTGRLLTFSRRRRLQPTRVDMNETVLGMMELMRRTLGETIGVGATLAPGLWPTRVDPSEIENAILNLAINARDAMPEGGRILIETSNVTLTREDLAYSADALAGDYVRLAVGDTGYGMPPEVLARAFEPFFTTKAPGKGTGLGLSTIYGFVRQSGGHATIYSEEGHGTTINLYLPRDRSQSALAPSPVALTTSETPVVGERILVVEDNEAVREATVRRLEALGYETSTAETGAAAIAILDGGLAVDLVLSDVVMPGGVSGYELADWMRANRPTVAVLLTSGFAPELADPKGFADGRVAAEAGAPRLLRKPYTRAELARTVRETLAE